MLDEHKGLRLVHEYETVFLEGAEVPDLVVGDHYGDPIGGLIDREGGWVASFGEGVQIYRIARPFTPYSRGTESGQWVTWDIPGDLRYESHIDSVRQNDDGRLLVSVAGKRPFEVLFEVVLFKGSIALAADGESVRETKASRRTDGDRHPDPSSNDPP